MEPQNLTPAAEREADKAPGWLRWLPGVLMLKSYQPGWLPSDLAGGLVLTTMLVPVGIAYAEASGVPGVYGLYATIIPLLVYAVFGPSRILVLGPDSALAAPILAVVLEVSGGDPARAIMVASMMAIVSGVVCIVMGLLRLGFITELLSKPIRYGYMNGIALAVLVSQLPKLFAISIEDAGPLREMISLGRAILAGETNWYSFAVGAGSLVLILFLKRFERIPGILIAVIIATLVVSVLHLDQSGVKVLGQIPQGLPAFVVPWVSDADLVKILLGGCAVALISFADTSVLSRTFAARTNTRVDPNQEMVGLGAANLAAGFFQASDQQQLVPYAGGRSRRREDPAYRRGGCAGRGGAADVRAQPAAVPAKQRAGRGGDRGGHRPVRGDRPEAHLPDPAVGVLAIHGVLCRGGGVRGHPGDHPGRGHRRD